jgi:hypothetical protein
VGPPPQPNLGRRAERRLVETDLAAFVPTAHLG